MFVMCVMYIYKVVFAIVLCKYISFSSKKEVSQAVFWLAPVQWVAKNSSADLITFLLALSDRQWSAHHALHTQCAEDGRGNGYDYLQYCTPVYLCHFAHLIVLFYCVNCFLRFRRSFLYILGDLILTARTLVSIVLLHPYA